MKRIIATLILALGVSFGSTALATAPAYAAGLFDDACKKASSSSVCQDKGKSTNPIYGKDGVLTKVVGILAVVIAIAAVIVLIIGGISYMTAGGDPGKIGNAKGTIIYALIGLVVAVAARAIVTFVLNKF